MLKLSEKGYQKYDIKFLIMEHIDVVRKAFNVDPLNGDVDIIESVSLSDGVFTTGKLQHGGITEEILDESHLFVDYFEDVKICIKYSTVHDEHIFAVYDHLLVYKANALYGPNLSAHRQCIEFKEKVMNGRERSLGSYSDPADVDSAIIREMLSHIPEDDIAVTPMEWITKYIEEFNPTIHQEGCILKLPLFRKFWDEYLTRGGMKAHLKTLKWTASTFKEIEKARDSLSHPVDEITSLINQAILLLINDPTLLFLVNRLTLESLIPVLQLHLDSPSDVVDSLPFVRSLVSKELILPDWYLKSNEFTNNEFINVLSIKLNEHLITIIKKMGADI